MEEYDIIYADPPWRYDFSKSDNRKIENHYPTMAIEEICGLDCHAADNSALYLWATAPKIEEALQVMKAWGFTYKTQMIWVKDKIGMGYYCRNKHEILMIGTKGKFHPPEPSLRPPSVFNGVRSKHSKKPFEIYNLIEKMYPGMRYYEMFCRVGKNGWSTFGNEKPRMQCTIHDFTDSLKEGLNGENIFKGKYGELFNTKLSQINFNDDKITQKQGIDFKAWISKVNFEIKTRSYETYKWNDILLETISIIENNKSGWLYTTQSDYIIYLWLNQQKTTFIDGYIINTKKLKDWIKTIDIKKYPIKIATSKNNNQVWHTENRPIPIIDFPKNIIKKLNIL